MSWKLTIRFDAPVHHGTGLGIAGIIDRAFLRDASGVPFLSGAAIKGKFRHAVSLICDPPPACRQSADIFCRQLPACPLCRIFGSPRFPAKLVFEDAYPSPEMLEVIREQAAHSAGPHLGGPSAVRHSTAINRLVRTVERRHLFSSETILPCVTFAAVIHGRLSSSDADLLRSAAVFLNHFGADSSRGLGFCSYFLEDAA